MKVLVIGSGGREHALGRKLSQSPRHPVLHFAPGNPGMAGLGTCHPVPAGDVDGLLALALRERFDLTVVGPEVPLALGLADRFQAAGLCVFGPTAAAARLESSKAFAKDFMRRRGIPTAAFGAFTTLPAARAFLEAKGAPIVVKASGLAAGKGAIVCPTLAEASQALEAMFAPGSEFGEAAREVVIEEFMEGEEASVFAICDGADYVLLPSAQDHKRVFDHDLGPNTGGMGAYSPAPVATPAILAEIERTIIRPTLAGMREEGCPFAGVLYVGAMVTPGEVKVVEFNCRFGDPETQVILPVYPGDLLELLHKAATGALRGYQAPAPAGSAVILVLAAGGYPGKYRQGDRIEGLDAPPPPGVHIIHAGTRREGNTILTNGGRILGVVAEAASLRETVDRAYQAANSIRFEGMHYRRDIASRGLKKLEEK